MSLDVAYSVDVDDYLDPDRAYELYWSGLISDKRNFLCPGTECIAQVTCANLDADIQDMKVSPHYKIYGAHSDKCEIPHGVPLVLKSGDAKSIKEERRTIDDSIVDVFLLERPDSYYDEPKINDHLEKEQAVFKKKTKRIHDAVLSERGGISNIYSVRSVVGRYIRYSKDGTLDSRRVNILGRDVKYKRIFRCIWEQDFSDLPEYPVIYYGWAYVNRLLSGQGYQIKFKKGFKKGGDEYTATILISDRLIESYKIKKLMSTRLKKIIEQPSPTGFVFVYGRPKENISSSGRRFANFTISNLDMIDINYDCPLPKEYDK